MRKVVPLSSLPEGCEGRVVSVEAGFGLTMRLEEMGFVRDARVKVLKSTRGPIMVQVQDFRVALGRGVASKIMVEVEGV